MGRGNSCNCWRAVDILNLIRNEAAAMRALATNNVAARLKHCRGSALFIQRQRSADNRTGEVDSAAVTSHPARRGHVT